MPDAKTALVETAERLFAAHGVDGVSMRDIAASAGQRNHSAVQYHFGGRDGLLAEVYRRRMGAINQARTEFLARADANGRGHDVRALVEAVLYPLADYLASAGPESHYARFLARVSPSLTFDATAEFAGLRDVSQRLIAALDQLPTDVARTRVGLILTMAVGALATAEQHNTTGHDLSTVVGHLIDMSVGALTAPHSPTPERSLS